LLKAVIRELQRRLHERIWDLIFGGQAGKGKRACAVLKLSRWRGAPRTSGRIFGGCNVENATYGSRVRRAHRHFKAISEGERGFDAIFRGNGPDTLTPPCGPAAIDLGILRRRSRDPGESQGKTKSSRCANCFQSRFDSSNL